MNAMILLAFSCLAIASVYGGLYGGFGGHGGHFGGHGGHGGHFGGHFGGGHIGGHGGFGHGHIPVYLITHHVPKPIIIHKRVYGKPRVVHHSLPLIKWYVGYRQGYSPIKGPLVSLPFYGGSIGHGKKG